MADALATATRINEYVSMYLSILCLLLLLQLQLQSRVFLFVCLFRSSTVHYQHQQYQHVLYQHLCHHDILPPSATGTPQQQLQLQPERDPAMVAMAIVARIQQHSSKLRTGNGIADQQAISFHHHGHTGERREERYAGNAEKGREGHVTDAERGGTCGWIERKDVV